jgi:hypothetical protein
MANTILTINVITREAIRLWKNSNAFIQNIDMQYDDSFAKTGAKIGTTLRIRLPNDFTVTTGPAASVQDTAEQNVTLTLATQKHVDVSFSSVDRSMSIDDFSRRVLAPMVNNLAGAVAQDVMLGADGTLGNPGICNFTATVDAGGNVVAPTSQTWLNAGALLDLNSCPRGRRKIMMDPLTQARTVQSLTGLFNPQVKISDQYETGLMSKMTLGFDWYYDQTVIKHTTAAYSGSLTVNGAGQTGLSIVVNAITGGLNVGDIITFAGVSQVNRITKQTTGQLRQFVVTAAVPSGGTLINIYPALIPFAQVPNPNTPVQYQTVDFSPANGAVITVVTLASAIYRKNIAFAPEAVTLATADLELPRGVHEAARDVYDGVAMRFVSAYNIATDQFISRLDVLYGYLFVRPEWACIIGDAL